MSSNALQIDDRLKRLAREWLTEFRQREKHAAAEDKASDLRPKRRDRSGCDGEDIDTSDWLCGDDDSCSDGSSHE